MDNSTGTSANPKSKIQNRNGPGSRIRTCEHLLPRQAHIAICGTPGLKFQISNLKFNMASGKGFEPLFLGSEPSVLPVRRSRNDLPFSNFDWRSPHRQHRRASECPSIRDRKSQIQNRKLEETEGLEPSTLSFEARRSDSVELRLHLTTWWLKKNFHHELIL